MLYKAKGAFVNFVTRDSAEEAAQASTSIFTLKGKSLRLQWAKSKGKRQLRTGTKKEPKAQDSSNGNQKEGKEAEESELDLILKHAPLPPPGSAGVFYPSMRPQSAE